MNATRLDTGNDSKQLKCQQNAAIRALHAVASASVVTAASMMWFAPDDPEYSISTRRLAVKTLVRLSQVSHPCQSAASRTVLGALGSLQVRATISARISALRCSMHSHAQSMHKVSRSKCYCQHIFYSLPRRWTAGPMSVKENERQCCF